MNDRFWNRFFYFCAFFNIASAANIFFAPKALVEALQVRPPLDPGLFLYGFTALIAIFGVAYYLVAIDLTQRRLVQVGLISKIVVPGLIIAFWLQGEVSWHLLIAGVSDLIFAGFFIAFLKRP